MKINASVICLGLAFCLTYDSLADEPNSGDGKSTASLPNVVAPTLGGTQLWSDEFIQRGYRIQRNAVTGHYRLLDDDNKRLTWGSWEQCFRRWEEIRTEKNVAPLAGKAVVLLHGLASTRSSMATLGKYLEQHGEFSVVNVSYASTRVDLTTHAHALGKVLEGLKEAEEINLVGHSLGNLVVRQYATDFSKPGQPRGIDPRIRRIVMLGPPNQGAQWGARFRDVVGFEPLLGKSGVIASSSADQVSRQLATPTCEFAIIAGGQRDGHGWNPLITGDDDLVVAVDETKLSGARDFLVLPVRHAQLPRDEKVCEHTLRFLQHGHLVSEEARQPLP